MDRELFSVYNMPPILLLVCGYSIGFIKNNHYKELYL